MAHSGVEKDIATLRESQKPQSVIENQTPAPPGMIENRTAARQLPEKPQNVIENRTPISLDVIENRAATRQLPEEPKEGDRNKDTLPEPLDDWKVGAAKGIIAPSAA